MSPEGGAPLATGKQGGQASFPAALTENHPTSFLILPVHLSEARPTGSSTSGGRAGGHSQISEAGRAKNCVFCSGSVFTRETEPVGCMHM